MNSRASGDTILWLLKILMQWGQKTLMFSLSVFALWPLGSLSTTVFVFLWLILFPSLHSHTAFHAALLFVPASLAIVSVSLDMYDSFASAITMLHIFLASLSSFRRKDILCLSLHEHGGDSVNLWLYFVFACFEPVHGRCDCFCCGFFACSCYVLEVVCGFFLGGVIVFVGICYLL